jgi:hypothetical protein
MNQRKIPPGRKETVTKHADELARVNWREFERIVGRWYAAQGYEVEHRGTGTARRLTDGGVDLVLRGRGEKILVQCKHEKALQVPYNPAMQLRGLIHAEDEPADRAILITSGEFTPEALRKARNAGLVEMIDGKALRILLGPDISSLRDGASAVVLSAPVSVALPAVETLPAVSAFGDSDAPNLDAFRPIGVLASRVSARPMSSRASRGVAAACAVLCLVAVAVVGLGSHEAGPEPLATTPAEPSTAKPPRLNPQAPQPARHATSVADATSHKRSSVPLKPKAALPKPIVEAAREPAPVIYKSSNMTDAEFAAWKHRKAQRDRQPAPDVSAAAAEPAAEGPPVPAQTMQTILRTNRK